MPSSRWHFDRTGFPYLVIPGSDNAMSLLPLTKYQLERWLAEPAGSRDEWYEQLLRLSPRASWRKPTATAWQLLATGLFPRECELVARWLGPAYRLPNVSEWRTADRAIHRLHQEDFHELLDLLNKSSTPAVSQFLQALWQNQRSTWGRISFLEDGIIEWVTRPQGEPGGLGRLSPDLCLKTRYILDPLAHDPVVPLRADRRVEFGVRLIYSPMIDSPRGRP